MPKYQTLFKLASGGMGTVVLARTQEGAFRRLCAIKRLKDDASPETRRMFLEEGRICGLLRHANVVPVVDAGEDEDGPFLVMEYVEGITIDKLIRYHAERSALVPLQLGLRIAREVAKALDAAHTMTDEHGEPMSLIHRDVSPSNVILGYDGGVRLTDFGIAKARGRLLEATVEGVFKGKLGYAAPEVLQMTAPASPSSDLFSLGVTLYETLSGSRLYSVSEGIAVAMKRLCEEPPPDLGSTRDDVPPEVVGVLFDLLAKSPELRSEDAKEVVDRLGECLDELIAEEGSRDLGSYLQRIFHEERAENAAKIADALGRVEAGSVRGSSPPQEPGTAETVAEPARKEQSRTWAVAAAVAVLLGVGGAAAMLQAKDPEPQTIAADTAPIPAPAATEELEPQEELGRDPGGDEVPEPVVGETGSTANEGETSEGETSEGETSEGETSEGETSEGETSEGEASEGESSESNAPTAPLVRRPPPERTGNMRPAPRPSNVADRLGRYGDWD